MAGIYLLVIGVGNELNKKYEIPDGFNLLLSKDSFNWVIKDVPIVNDIPTATDEHGNIVKMIYITDYKKNNDEEV